MIAPVQNKLGGLLTDTRLFRILVSPETPISFRRLIDTGGVLIANLAKGHLGEDSASILRPFFLYVDEFQTVTTLAFATLLPELRKTGVGLVLAHQHLH